MFRRGLGHPSGPSIFVAQSPRVKTYAFTLFHINFVSNLTFAVGTVFVVLLKKSALKQAPLIWAQATEAETRELQSSLKQRSEDKLGELEDF